MAKLDCIEIDETSYELVPEIAPLFNTSTQYSTGDYVIKDAVLYRFKATHASGAWSASQVDEVTAGSELKSIKNDKLDKNQGTANTGKYLKVGANGDVETADLDVTTDKTLSIADKAADAKAVGDEITNLKADLNEIYYDKDSNVYRKSGELHTELIRLANGSIIGGKLDTQPIIAYHGKGLHTGDPADRAGLCVTKIYSIHAGDIIRYYITNPASASASGMNRYQDMDGTTINRSVAPTVGSETNTVVLTGDGIRFTLFEAGVNTSYAYVKDTGEILFAGEDTQYFGKRNINGSTTPSETLISDKNAKEKLLNYSGLIIGKDGKVHLSYEGGATDGDGISFADGAIVSGMYDTKINIAEYGKVASSDGATYAANGGCYTEFYDLVSENAQIKYYFPNPSAIAFSNNQKIQWWRDDTFVGFNHTTMGAETLVRCSNNTTPANKVRCSLAIAGIDDSWCIDNATGTVIFAGKNTEYYGLKNISDTPDPTPRDYGVIGANYPEEIEVIEKHLVSGATYESVTGITNRFAFCHTSDVHGASANLWGIGYSDEFTDLSDAAFLAMTGDNVSDKATDSFDNVKALINGMTKPCYITFGNHDVATSTAQSTRFDHQFGEIKEHNGQSSLQTSYYAVDFVIGKQAEKQNTSGSNDSANGIKCIFLDCYDGIDDYTGYNMAQICDGHMSATQINWFAGQLQDAITNAYHVVVFMHHAPDVAGLTIDKFLDGWGYAKNLAFIADIVNAFQSYNASVTVEHMGNSYTFSFSGQGAFVGYFVGHTHCDGAFFLNRYPRQLVVTVVTPFGNGSTSSGTNMNHGLGVMFNYVTIDKKKRRVTVFRVGNQDTYYGFKRDLFSVRYY